MLKKKTGKKVSCVFGYEAALFYMIFFLRDGDIVSEILCVGYYGQWEDDTSSD